MPAPRDRGESGRPGMLDGSRIEPDAWEAASATFAHWPRSVDPNIDEAQSREAQDSAGQKMRARARTPLGHVAEGQSGRGARARHAFENSPGRAGMGRAYGVGR